MVKRKIRNVRSPMYCPICDKYVRGNFYLHAENHVKRLVKEGVVREELFDFGVERRIVWVYKDRYYLTPTSVLLDVLEDAWGGGDGDHTRVRIDH
ncbi:MAG: hypothetical protein JHC26_02705 [Thermofilum sp.]|jgi:hypothetical protein|uniref:hypothetical protein n=1 Tax=Thermofilum sp. TaxID=1961369 RepID=UPI0025891C0D|nr:hypothetical protein [Thermofilum sp.]MCI4407976.1 hypothetical protein [Thermofilum sp.]